MIFPAAGPTEIDGTFTNLEGRISVVSRKVTPPGTARPDWMIAVDLAHYLNKDLGFNSVEEDLAEIEKFLSIHNGVIEALSDNAREGVLVEGELELLRPEKPVQSHDAYSFRLIVTRSMYDQGVFNAHSQSLKGLTPDSFLGLSQLILQPLSWKRSRSRSLGPKGSVTLLRPDSKVAKRNCPYWFQLWWF